MKPAQTIGQAKRALIAIGEAWERLIVKVERIAEIIGNIILSLISIAFFIAIFIYVPILGWIIVALAIRGYWIEWKEGNE